MQRCKLIILLSQLSSSIIGPKFLCANSRVTCNLAIIGPRPVSMVNSLFYLYQLWTHYFTWINGELIILPVSMVNSLFSLNQWWTHYFTSINGELIILPLSMVNSLFYLCQWGRIQFVNDRLVQTHSIISLQFFHGFWVVSF